MFMLYWTYEEVLDLSQVISVKRISVVKQTAFILIGSTTSFDITSFKTFIWEIYYSISINIHVDKKAILVRSVVCIAIIDNKWKIVWRRNAFPRTFPLHKTWDDCSPKLFCMEKKVESNRKLKSLGFQIEFGSNNFTLRSIMDWTWNLTKLKQLETIGNFTFKTN